MEKKKTIKINFKYFGERIYPENNFFTKLLRKKYNVVISDNPDYMFYSIYPEVKKTKDLSKKGDFFKKISPNLYLFLRKIYSILKNFSQETRPPVPQGNFIKIFYGAENIKPNMEECDWAFSSQFEEEINNPRYLRIPNYRFTNYQLEEKGKPKVDRKIDFKRIKKEKTKFCNFIYSQDIPFRNNFFKELCKYKHIDSPGRCMTNMPPIKHGDAKKSRTSENWVKEKLAFLKNYKFTIAFENCSYPGWTTEKLVHPFLVNSIPIYFGDKEVHKDFNIKSFINYHDFENMREFINHIIKVDNNDELYLKYLKESPYNNKRLSKYMQDKRIMERFKEIFG
ncbi:hypothetical protein KAJ87_03475 [Candidatus Pacearchaeota archaeon]|nr:hypothetical protein [Candidatus Pacearchaeota archaeon]